MIDLSTIPLTDLIAEIRRRDTHAVRSIQSEAAEIIAAESDATGIPATVILSRVRTTSVAAARMRAMAALYRRGYSSTQVGSIFRRDHATVLHALKSA